MVASPEAIAAASDPRVAQFLARVRRAMLHCLESHAFEGPIISNSGALLDYLRLELGHAPREQVRVLYLNAANLLIANELLGLGSVSEAPLYPREIVRRALELGATALILVHNHPSGDPSPSRSDLQATARIADAARLFDILLHDHLIVTRGGSESLRALGLL